MIEWFTKGAMCSNWSSAIGDRREGGVHFAKETLEEPMMKLKGMVFAWIKFR